MNLLNLPQNEMIPILVLLMIDAGRQSLFDIWFIILFTKILFLFLVWSGVESSLCLSVIGHLLQFLDSHWLRLS